MSLFEIVYKIGHRIIVHAVAAMLTVGKTARDASRLLSQRARGLRIE